MVPLVSQQILRIRPGFSSRATREALMVKGSWGEGSPPKKQIQEVFFLTARASSRGALKGDRLAAIWRYWWFWQYRQSKEQAPKKTARLL